MPYQMAEKEANYNFINPEYAKSAASKDDLLILVDTHKPSLSACPALTEIIEKVVVIDHHRRGRRSCRTRFSFIWSRMRLPLQNW